MDLFSLSGFFSYAHNDDYNGFLSRLQKDLCSEFKVISGQDLMLFFDRTNIKWGEKWQESINGGIDSASFFIPVLSPSYFLSENCVRELSQYMEKAIEWESSELLLPIKFVTFDTNDLVTNSDLYKKVNDVVIHQWEDWTELRFADPSSTDYQKAVNRMAKRILDANNNVIKAIEKNSSISKDIDLSVDNDEDPSGYYLDSVAEFEEWSNDLTANLSDLEQDINEIGGIMNDGAAEMNSLSASNRTPQAYLSISAKVGRELGDVANRYYDKSQITAKLIYSFEPKMNSIIRFLCEQKNISDDANNQLVAISNMSSVAKDAREKLDGFIAAISGLERMSRPLYNPLRKIKNATVICNGAFGVVEGWGDEVADFIKS